MTKNNTKKPDNVLYIIILILILMFTVIIYAVLSKSGTIRNTGPSELDGFAQCLTNKGATFYGTEWCGFCQQQKKMFGNAMQHINFVDCDKNRNTCTQERITGYPTWKIEGQYYPGLQQLQTLSDLTACEMFE